MCFHLWRYLLSVSENDQPTCLNVHHERWPVQAKVLVVWYILR